MARAVGPSAQRQHLYEIADVCCWRIGGAAYEAIGETEYGLPRRILTIADRGALAGQRCTQKCLTRSIRGDRPLRVPELPRQRVRDRSSGQAPATRREEQRGDSKGRGRHSRGARERREGKEWVRTC